MTKQVQKTFHIFYHSNNKRAVLWAPRIRLFLARKYPAYKHNAKAPDYVIALGGDGTILEAARKYGKTGSIILGLNLGTVGFLASARKEKDFLKAIDIFLKGKSGIIERMMIVAQVKRKGKVVFNSEALNEIVIKDPLGVVKLQVKIEDHPVQYVRGTGILVSTATGSTAYNLSAHGPIIMPDIRCLIITELLDHSIPTPSMVIKYNNKITIRIIEFKKRGLLSLSRTGEKIDVILNADGESIFPLEASDEIVIRGSATPVKFAELEKHYFFKSLEEIFGFR